MATPEEARRIAILDEAESIGQHMDGLLPFKKGGILSRLAGAAIHTKFAVERDASAENLPRFTRRWLERSLMRRPTDSPVRMIEDTVGHKHAGQIGTNSHVIAVYYPETEGPSLWLPDTLGLPQSKVAVRVHEIGSFATAIEEAGLMDTVRRAGALPPDSVTV